MKRMWMATVLAATLGMACVNQRQAAGVFMSEPMVEIGVFTRVGQEGKAWVFDPMAPWEQTVRVWVTPDTSVVENGTQVDLSAVKPGSRVRLVYELRRDGTGVAERIDVISQVTGEALTDTDT